MVRKLTDTNMQCRPTSLQGSCFLACSMRTPCILQVFDFSGTGKTVSAVIRASGLRWKSTRHRFLTAFAQARSISLLNLVKPSNQFRSKNKSSPIEGHHPQEKPVIVVGVHERGNRGRHRGWPQVPPDDVY
jgi:hypothetical protein